MIYFYSILLMVFIPFMSLAQESSNDTSRVSFKPNKNPEVNITKVSDGSITLDGKLDEDIWKTAAKVDNFTEIAPRDNVKPEVETVGYITYDNDNVYFAFICYEQMGTLRASMTDRDRMYQDDWVGPFIDTYNDQKQAFEFYSNPYGIQGDLVWTPNYEDSSPDFIFTSETKIYNDRWTVEMRIPFKSLRFPETDVQTWRVHILRNRPRANRERIYWASVSRDDPNFLGQAGLITGIKGVKGGKQLEVLPYVIGNQSSFMKDNISTSLDTSQFKGDFGFSLKYGITSNIVADATYNPDFSQVEADQPQIDVNKPFALFFQEKRPFFLEGISAFRLPLNMVYTRAINNPLFATKITGKLGKFNIGYMTAYDEDSPFIIPLEERSIVRSSEFKSLSNILRVKYDLGGENYIGALLTDREVSPDDTKLNFNFKGYNRTAALDFKFNFLTNYYFGGQITGYATRELSDTNFITSTDRFGSENQHTAKFDGEAFTGLGTFFNFNREAENWSFYTEYNYSSATARRELGFLDRNNYHTGYMYQSYNFYPSGKIFQRINPDLTGGLTFNEDGVRKDQYLYPGITVEFKHGSRVWGNYVALNNEAYGGIEHKGLTRFNIGAENYSLKAITGGIFYERGKFIYRTTPSFIGYGQFINVWTDLKPIDRLAASFSYVYQDLAKSWGGEMLYAGWIISNTTRYQFNKHLFARLVSSYSSFDHSFQVDPLVSYKWNPFTVLYVGSTHSLNEFDDEANPGRQKLRESARQIFIKFQYLFQL